MRRNNVLRGYRSVCFLGRLTTDVRTILDGFDESVELSYPMEIDALVQEWVRDFRPTSVAFLVRMYCDHGLFRPPKASSSPGMKSKARY